MSSIPQKLQIALTDALNRDGRDWRLIECKDAPIYAGYTIEIEHPTAVKRIEFQLSYEVVKRVSQPEVTRLIWQFMSALDSPYITWYPGDTQAGR